MALAPLASAVGVNVASGVETQICSWTSDGVQKIAFWNGLGTYPARFRLYINEAYHSGFMIDETDRTAYIPVSPGTVPNGQVVSLKVYHEADSNQTYDGSICPMGT